MRRVARHRLGVGLSSSRSNSRIRFACAEKAGKVAVLSMGESGVRGCDFRRWSAPSDRYHGRCANTKTVIGFFHLDSHRETLGEPDPIEISRDVGEAHGAGPVFWKNSPARSDDFSPEPFPAFELQIDLRRSSLLYVFELGLAEIRHDIPCPCVHQ